MLYGEEILNKSYHLTKENKYEVDGWYWFDNVWDAENFLYSNEDAEYRASLAEKIKLLFGFYK